MSEVRLMTATEVIARCHICRTALYAMIKKGTFPKPAKVGSNSRWLSSEIDEWIKTLGETRG